ncbi:MAG: TIGR00153 family protein [bacterium]
MRTIAKIFGKSPFSPLQSHMSRVADCVEKVDKFFEALQIGDQDEIERVASEVSELEHAADLAKNDIRNNLPKGLFLPVDKASLLDILSVQDKIADKTEDIGHLLVLRKLRMADDLKDDFKKFLNKNIEAFNVAQRIIQQMDELLESSFGGVEAKKVREMVDDVAFKEHESDLLQKKLLKKLFGIEEVLSHGSFILWLRIIETIGSISDLSENLGNRVRTILDIK